MSDSEEEEEYDDIYGVQSNNPEILIKRLNRGWHPQDRAKALLDRVDLYAKHYKTTVKKLRIPVSLHGAAQQSNIDESKRELQILEQVIAEGEEADKQGAFEALVAHQIRNGPRDFIDDALDEVGHVSAAPKAGKTKTFNWRNAGHHLQLPGLMRSIHTNSVTDGAEEVMRKIRGGDEDSLTFSATDFTKDFCQSRVRGKNAEIIKEERMNRSMQAWRSRVKPLTSSAEHVGAAAKEAAASGSDLVAVNAHRCCIGCKNCYEKVEKAVADRKLVEVPYDDWERNQRLANKQVREHRILMAEITRAGFRRHGGFSPESSVLGSPKSTVSPQSSFAFTGAFETESSRFGKV
jgi:hypothetical protein